MPAPRGRRSGEGPRDDTRTRSGMIRRHGFLLRAILVGVDATLAVVVLLVVAVLRFGMDGVGQLTATIAEPRTALVAYVIAWIGSLWSQDLYRFRPRWTTRATLIDILRATAIFAVASLALLFWFKLPDVSRFLLVLLFPGLAATVFLSRVAPGGTPGAFWSSGPATSPGGSRFSWMPTTTWGSPWWDTSPPRSASRSA